MYLLLDMSQLTGVVCSFDCIWVQSQSQGWDWLRYICQILIWYISTFLLHWLYWAHWLTKHWSLARKYKRSLLPSNSTPNSFIISILPPIKTNKKYIMKIFVITKLQDYKILWDNLLFVFIDIWDQRTSGINVETPDPIIWRWNKSNIMQLKLLVSKQSYSKIIQANTRWEV